MQLQGKRCWVVGLARSGCAAGGLLRRHGASVLGLDDSDTATLHARWEREEVAATAASCFDEVLDGGRAPQGAWAAPDLVVISPGVPGTHPRLAGLPQGVPVIGELELGARFCRAVPVAITGTNGKSTTTALTAHLLACGGHAVQLGGNIGTAILSLKPPHTGQVHVIEVSSYQIDLAPSLDPTVGVLINVSEDHLDRHGTLAHYAAVKERLVTGVQEGGTAIVGVDDNWCQAAADRVERAGKTVVRVSVRRPLADGLYVEAEQIMRASGGSARAIARLGQNGSLRGAHNAQNAACASGVALALGVSPDVIQQGLRTFPGLAHRMEEIGRKGRVLFVNDSKATNADSAAQALACFSDIFWIAGGKPKTGGLASLAGFFPRMRKAYLIGEAAAGFAAELEGHVPHVIAGTLDRAVELAARDAEAADLAEPVVLLSPACASFDQFRNFEARGDAFRELVLALPGVVAKR